MSKSVSRRNKKSILICRLLKSLPRMLCVHFFFFFFFVNLSHLWYLFLFMYWSCIMIYSWLSLSRSPRNSLKYFEISDPRHIRFTELRKNINLTNTFHKWLCNLTPTLEIYWKIFWKYCGREEKVSSIPQYFVTWCYIFMFKQGPDFHFEISGYSR